jgi:hypothetical protein
MKRIDKNNITIEEKDIVVAGNIRDEEFRLPYFLQYHREIGVTKFIIVDNNSTDNSQNYLIAQPDVMTYFTDQPYAESRYGINWVNTLLDEYGVGKWTLTLDAVELFVYPRMEQIPLKDFCNYVENQQKNAVTTIMIDMYSDKAITDAVIKPGDNFFEVCAFFDGNLSIEDDRSSTRRRIFWGNEETVTGAFPPVVQKTPLVKWEKGFEFLASTHTIENISIANETGALLHFKFFHNLIQYTENTVREKNHWNNSAQYKVYNSGLQENPELSPYFEHSVRYSNSQQLIDLGLIHTTPEFERYAVSRNSNP